MQVVVVGGSLTGNKGAASMVLGLIDELDDCGTAVLTPSARSDRASRLAGDSIVAAFGPIEIITACLLALVTRLSRGRIATPALRCLWRADVVADVSGISFVDGRGGLTLVYNVLLVLPALLLGRPVVKVSQAMGPFERTSTRMAARLVLPRMAAVLARGERTVDHLEAAGLHHDGLVPDSAFLMRVGAADEDWADEVVAALPDGERPPVVVAPSQVVVGQASDGGVAYRAAVVALLDHLTFSGPVIVMAHAAQPGQSAGRLNDLPLCEEVVAACARPARCRVVGGDATPRQLRALMARCEFVVASRFHAMISALATATPVIVVGWSHKYREVLRAFGQAELALDHRSITPDVLVAAVEETAASATSIRTDLALHAQRAREAARRNAQAVRSAGRAAP